MSLNGNGRFVASWAPPTRDQYELIASLPSTEQSIVGTPAFSFGQSRLDTSQPYCLWQQCTIRRKFYPEPKLQGTADDCVSFAFASAVEYVICLGSGRIDIISTEVVYGLSRAIDRSQHRRGSGTNGYSARQALIDNGVIARSDPWAKDYGIADYNQALAVRWGDTGVPPLLQQKAKLHPVRGIKPVKSFDEAAALIRSGYPVTVGSMQSFPSPKERSRDSEGFLGAGAVYRDLGHCMVFIGVRYDRPGLCCLNSWGPYQGAFYPDDSMPDEAFWVDKNVANNMLSGWAGAQDRPWPDAWAVSELDSFPYLTT